MTIGISNLAWDAGGDAEIAPALVAAGVRSVDVAPGKYALEPGWPASASRVRRWWAAREITVGALQSLFHGHPTLDVFAAPEPMLAHLASRLDLAGELGATKLVFGSPGNRRPGARPANEAWAMALDFLHAAGELAAARGCVLCVEAAPVAYGGEFAVTTEDAARWVAAVGHRAVRLQLDIGIAALGAEPLDALLAAHASLVGHVHLSEPLLLTLGDGATDHHAAAQALRRHLPTMPLTVEMLPQPGSDGVTEVARALRLAKKQYLDVE
ncbi:MAG: sugar phosphate isomerase/epimerase [Myxococcales bacterium]|nr:sugar phosphate isomerase/epimerase [Myxococcales bacterium]